MKIIDLKRQEKPLSPCVATIGFFDGVHQGHRHLIGKVLAIARSQQLASTVITFSRHPRQVLQPDWHPQLLSTFDEKVALLSQTGVDRLVVLPFDRQMAALSARDFMERVLHRQLNVQVLVTGYDNHFGHRLPGAAEGFDDYVTYGRSMGMTVLQGDPLDVAAVRVSSSKVRRMLERGDVLQAAQCLGRPYELSGVVVSGEHIGTALGFPTANLQLTDSEKLIPSPGVYAVNVCVGQSAEVWHGMMNIGSRPTFGGDHMTLETHIFHFDGNLYGQSLTIRFIERLRAERKFDSREALVAQLAADARQAELLLNC